MLGTHVPLWEGSIALGEEGDAPSERGVSLWESSSLWERHIPLWEGFIPLEGPYSLKRKRKNEKWKVEKMKRWNFERNIVKLTK